MDILRAILPRSDRLASIVCTRVRDGVWGIIIDRSKKVNHERENTE